MAAPFLICALPRSRTAWLANFLTFGGIECGHELMSALSTEGLAHHLAGSKCAYAGNSDTVQALLLDDLRARMPEAPIVVVKREPAEVVESLGRIGLPLTVHQLGPVISAVEAASRLSNTLTVRYSDLSAESSARAILAHVAPSETFNRYRWQMLNDLNVQVSDRRVQHLKRLAELAQPICTEL